MTTQRKASETPGTASPPVDQTLTGTEITPAPDGTTFGAGESFFAEDPSGVEDPVLYKEMTDKAKDLYRQRQDLVEKGVPSERLGLPDWPYMFKEHVVPDDLPPLTGTIDVGAFVKAQATFLRMQTWFLQHRGSPSQDPEVYIHNLTQYSLAQADFIAAQSEVLRQVGVI